MTLTLERDIEQKLRRRVESRGGLCLKWVCPGWAGVPDRIILLPGGRICFVETKRPAGGSPSMRQLRWHKKLAAKGFRVYVVWNLTDLQAFEAAEL